MSLRLPPFAWILLQWHVLPAGLQWQSNPYPYLRSAAGCCPLPIWPMWQQIPLKEDEATKGGKIASAETSNQRGARWKIISENARICALASSFLETPPPKLWSQGFLALPRMPRMALYGESGAAEQCYTAIEPTTDVFCAPQSHEGGECSSFI